MPAVWCPVGKGWFGEQVSEGHVEGVGQGLDDRQAVQFDPVVLNLAEPVDGTADDRGKDLLRHAASPSVPGDAFTDRQCVGHATHGSSSGRLCSTTPERFSRVPAAFGHTLVPWRRNRAVLGRAARVRGGVGSWSVRGVWCGWRRAWCGWPGCPVRSAVAPLIVGCGWWLPRRCGVGVGAEVCSAYLGAVQRKDGSQDGPTGCRWSAKRRC